jgi:hypothetical protein
MAVWYDLKGTFQNVFKIGGKSKTAIDANAPTVLRTFFMPDSSVDLRGGVAGQIISQTGANTIGWLDNYSEALVTGAFNDTGSNIAKGQVVYFDGRQGDRPRAFLARANALNTSDTTVGLAYETVGTGLDIRIVENGLLKGINTDVVGWTEGDILWLDAAVAGAITNVRPTGANYAIEIGILVRKHVNQGVILVRVSTNPKLDQLQNVSIPSTPTNGQVLTYNSSTGVWYADTPGGGGGGGYTEIPNGGTLTGTYSGEVYCVGDVSLASNTLVKGSLYIVGNITNPLGHNLSVDGDLLVEGSLDFTRSTVAQTGELTVQGDCHVGYEIENVFNENFIVYNNLSTETKNTSLGINYQTTVTAILPSSFIVNDCPVGSKVTINSIPYDLLAINTVASPTESVSTAIDPQNFSLSSFGSFGATFQARGIVAGDIIQFASGANSGQTGAILTISGNDLTFASGTFTSTPSSGDQVIITPSSRSFATMKLKGLAVVDAEALGGLSGLLEYSSWKSFIFREQVTTANEIFVGGNLSCFRFDVSASQTSINVKGKEVTIEGNLTLKSFESDLSGVSYYDYILLQGSEGCTANTLTVRGSLYNGSIFGRPSRATTGSSPSQASNVRVYGNCILSSINAYSLFSGFVDLSSNQLVNPNTVSRKGGGDFFVGGNFVGSGIVLNGGTYLSGLSTFASSSGDLTVQGDIFVAFGAFGGVSGMFDPPTISPTDSQLNNLGTSVTFQTQGRISLNGGVGNASTTGGSSGILYCGGSICGYNFLNGGVTAIESRAGNDAALGKITILGDCFLTIIYEAGYTTTGSPFANVGGDSSGFKVFIRGNAYSSITIGAGKGFGSFVNGGNVLDSCIRVEKNLYGSLTIFSGSSELASGGNIGSSPINFDGNYLDSLNIISGSGVKGGNIGNGVFGASQIPTIRNFSLLSGNGTTGPAGSILTSNSYNFNCVGTISVRLGNTQNSTTPLDFLDQTVTINGSANVDQILVRNMSATAAGGLAGAGINLTINGSVTLRDRGTITLQGGNATTGSSSRSPRLRINGNLIGNLNDTANTGVIIEGGSVTTGNASLGNVGLQTLFVVGDVNIGRITVNGGNQTSSTGSVDGSAGDIASGAIFVSGKLKAARITMTGGNLTSSGAIAGQRGGNAGLVECGSLNTTLLTCNGGTVNASAATKGSAGGFRISNLIVTDNSYIGTFSASDSAGGTVATTNAVQTQLAGHVIIDAWILPTRTTYIVKCIGVPTSLIVRSFTGKNRLADVANNETALTLVFNSMYFSTGSTWRFVNSTAFT